MKHVWFHDTLDYRRNRIPSIPHPLKSVLACQPTLAQGQDADLKWETEVGGFRLRYWLSRLTFRDRPMDNSIGGNETYEGMYPSIFVEAYFDGYWVLVDGYQGHII